MDSLKCSANTQAGKRCKLAPLSGKLYCSSHQRINDQCKAATTQGRQCRRKATQGQFCSVHLPKKTSSSSSSAD